MADWEIYKPLGECAATGKKIEFGEEYFGALVEGADGLERKDFSAEYWYNERPDVYCYWRSRLPNPRPSLPSHPRLFPSASSRDGCTRPP